MPEKIPFTVYLPKDWRKHHQSNLLVTTKAYQDDPIIKKLTRELFGENHKILLFNEIEPWLSHRLFDCDIKKTVSSHKYNLYTMNNRDCAKFLYYEKIKKLEERQLEKILRREKSLKNLILLIQERFASLIAKRKRKTPAFA